MSEAEFSSEAEHRRFRPYPKYKASGVEWMSEIPAHWERSRIKFLARIASGYAPPDGFDLTSGEYPIYGSNGLIGYCDRFFVTEMTIAVGRVGASGSVNFIPPNSWVSDNALLLHHLRPHVNLIWLYNLLSTMNLGEQASKNAQPIITGTFLGNQFLGLPPEQEQRAMASFLDRETAKIDALIEKKERLIELLQEKRTALITQAVTKSLNPTVPMKDSGIEWLGEIPAHWDLLPLKRCVLPKAGSIKTGPFGSQLLAADMQGEDVKVYNQRTVIDRDFLEGDVFISRQKFQELKAFEIYPGDVLVTTRGTIGRCAIVPAESDQGILHPCLMRIQPDPAQLIREFITLLIQESYLVKTQLALASNATTIDVIYSDTISRILVPKPPLHEQVSIVKWIDERSAEICRLDKMVSAAIDRLKEYRTALISAAVTGKIDVRISN